MATPPGRQRAAGGFTLVELLATLMVVGLLFALVLPNLGALVEFGLVVLEVEDDRGADADDRQ